MQQSNNPQPDDVGRPNRTKSKRARPYVLEYRVWDFLSKDWGDWRRLKAYRTEAERQAAMDNMMAKWSSMFGRQYMDFRIPEETESGA